MTQDRIDEIDEMTEVCPECGSWDTEEHHYPDDMMSYRCRWCRYTGSPGEDFPAYYKVVARCRHLERQRRAMLEALRIVLDAASHTVDEHGHVSVWLDQGEFRQIHAAIAKAEGGAS